MNYFFKEGPFLHIVEMATYSMHLDLFTLQIIYIFLGTFSTFLFLPDLLNELTGFNNILAMYFWFNKY